MSLTWIFPALCIHCREECGAVNELLCRGCLEQMNLLKAEARRDHGFDKGTAAAFEAVGAPLSLFRFVRQGHPGAAHILAAFMVMRWAELGWPYPDWIVAKRSTFAKWLAAEDVDRQLAIEVGKMLERPVRFFPKIWSQKGEFDGKTILIVDPYLSNKWHWAKSEGIFSCGFPRAIYFLSFLSDHRIR